MILGTSWYYLILSSDSGSQFSNSWGPMAAWGPRGPRGPLSFFFGQMISFPSSPAVEATTVHSGGITPYKVKIVVR